MIDYMKGEGNWGALMETTSAFHSKEERRSEERGQRTPSGKTAPERAAALGGLRHPQAGESQAIAPTHCRDTVNTQGDLMSG